MTLSTDEILEIVKMRPEMLGTTGKILNTWRLVLGQSTIPRFYIDYMEVITESNELVTLNHFDGKIGYDEDGTPYSLNDIRRIIDIDAVVILDNSYITDLKLIEDVLYYPKERRYVTLAYLMNIETDPIYINSLPLFDHTTIKYNFADKVVVGIDNYELILQPISYMNCNLQPNEYGMVKIAYDVEVPYTMFFNRRVNEELSGSIPCIPLISHSLTVSFGDHD